MINRMAAGSRNKRAMFREVTHESLRMIRSTKRKNNPGTMTTPTYMIRNANTDNGSGTNAQDKEYKNPQIIIPNNIPFNDAVSGTVRCRVIKSTTRVTNVENVKRIK